MPPAASPLRASSIAAARYASTLADRDGSPGYGDHQHGAAIADGFIVDIDTDDRVAAVDTILDVSDDEEEDQRRENGEEAERRG